MLSLRIRNNLQLYGKNWKSNIIVEVHKVWYLSKNFQTRKTKSNYFIGRYFLGLSLKKGFVNFHLSWLTEGHVHRIAKLSRLELQQIAHLRFQMIIKKPCYHNQLWYYMTLRKRIILAWCGTYLFHKQYVSKQLKYCLWALIQYNNLIFPKNELWDLSLVLMITNSGRRTFQNWHMVEICRGLIIREKL